MYEPYLNFICFIRLVFDFDFFKIFPILFDIFFYIFVFSDVIVLLTIRFFEFVFAIYLNILSVFSFLCVLQWFGIHSGEVVLFCENTEFAIFIDIFLGQKRFFLNCLLRRVNFGNLKNVEVLDLICIVFRMVVTSEVQIER